MRFLHTADWHLGKLLHGVHLTDDQAVLLDQIVEAVETYCPDVVIVAGDVYDRSIPPAAAVDLLDDVLSRLVLGCDVPVVAIAGNHDSPDRLDFGSSILRRQGLHVFSKLRAEPGHCVIEDDHGPVHIVGLPYAEPSTARAVFRDPDAEVPFPEDQPLKTHDDVLAAQVATATDRVPDGDRSIAVAHVFTQGGLTSESERTLSVGGADTVDADRFAAFDYTALGHLHRRQTPAAEVHYSGSLMKYSFNEWTDDKSFAIVDMDAEGACTVETVPLTPRRDLRKIEGTMDAVLSGAADAEDGAKDDYLWVTLTNEEAVVDAMSRIREVYPNALHVERPRQIDTSVLQTLDGDASTMDAEEVFAQFFRYVTDTEALTDAQHDVLATALDRVREAERKA